MAKDQRTKQTTDTKPELNLVDDLGIGHQPARILDPQDTELFQAFQSNLLSLISHELRTPLTGIINALGVIDNEGTSSEMGKEFLSIARRNAQQLNHSLSSLLDLAAIESGAFHVRFTEIDLRRLVQQRLLVVTENLLTVECQYPVSHTVL